MKIIELFSGTESFSKSARERGHKTFTIDFDKQFNPDLCIDIMDFDVSMLPKEFKNPDIIWASPPCEAFSVSTISRNWKNGKPISEKAKKSLMLIQKVEEIIKSTNPKFFFIENPRGMLRKQHLMLKYHKKTLTYCQYGELRMKPTDIWTNLVSWIPKQMCRVGDPCHQRQPRTYKSKKAKGVLKLGTQGLKDSIERAKIPEELCNEILNNVESKNVKIKQQTLK